ncbi:MAG: LacI family transcriptional regulator [Actinomycetales bacterium]|nr:LacI family transcriptional regulator [Actinomycetales bacterium]
MAMVMTAAFDDYPQQLVRGVLGVLAPHGFTLVVSTFDPFHQAMPVSVAQLLRTTSPYGVIAAPSSSTQAETDLAGLLDELEIPVVRISACSPGKTSIRSDDRIGMQALMGHLLDERGVRRLALARGIPHQPDSVLREQVFREELAARGIPVDEELVFEGAFWHETTYRELRALLRRRRDVDAVVASNDLSALGALAAVADEGLRVPDDVLVTGFDNDASALSWPDLTTVDPRLREQGAAAAERLLAEIDGVQPGGEILVPSRVLRHPAIRRGSPPPSTSRRRRRCSWPPGTRSGR